MRKNFDFNIIMISALSKNRVIGKNGEIPWYLPKDLKRFKKLTTGFPVVMGRKTFDSLPSSVRPLPGRLNYVLSKTLELNYDSVFVARSIDKVLNNMSKKQPFMEGIDYSKLWIIGGESVYRSFLPLADRMELTFLNKDFDGDTYFPKFNNNDWNLKKVQEYESFSFKTFIRK